MSVEQIFQNPRQESPHNVLGMLSFAERVTELPEWTKKVWTKIDHYECENWNQLCIYLFDPVNVFKCFSFGSQFEEAIKDIQIPEGEGKKMKEKLDQVDINVKESVITGICAQGKDMTDKIVGIISGLQKMKF